jgi:hypothetical protein
LLDLEGPSMMSGDASVGSVCGSIAEDCGSSVVAEYLMMQDGAPSISTEDANTANPTMHSPN